MTRGAAWALKEREGAARPPPTDRAKLPLDEIEVVEAVFQPRAGFSKEHAGQLTKALREMGELDPILVIQLGERPVVIDGHHRLKAYRMAGRTAIPAVYFAGTLLEAVERAGAENTKTRLPMSPQERQDYAWRLTTMMGAELSIARVGRAAGVSESQVSNMRKAMRILGPRAAQFPAWWQARQAADGGPVEMDETQRKAWIDAKAESYADRLYREFGTKLTSNREIAALALSLHFREKLSDLVDELAGIVGKRAADDDGADGDDEACAF
jgi:ParB-like chromosome segregation protein Spo0J